MQGSARAGAVVAGLAIGALWGVTPALYKRVLDRISPSSLIVFYAAILATCCFVWAAFFAKDIARDFARMRAGDWAMLAIGAGLGGFIASVLFVYLIARYEVHWVTGLAYTAPLFTAVLAWAWLGERVSGISAVGAALIVVGAGLLAGARA